MAAPGAILLDIDGCVVAGIGREALPGAVAAVDRLRERWPVRFVTNTTSRSHADLVASLRHEGFTFAYDELITPASLARQLLTERGHDRGLLLADESSRTDLDWFTETHPEEAQAVLIATEAHDRRISDLRDATVALLGGASLYTLQQNRYFRRDGKLLTDLGPVAAFLGYAADVDWVNLGKPSPTLFTTIANHLSLTRANLVMVGDDAEFDVAGALKAGVGRAFLVRTGKYRPGDETRVTPPPTRVIDSITDLPNHL